MGLQGHWFIEEEASGADTLVLGEGDRTALDEQPTAHAEIDKLLMMDVAEVEENSPPHY